MTGAEGRALAVVQVSRVVQAGGAERVAASLHEGLLSRGHQSWMAIADDHRQHDDPSILTIPSGGPRRGNVAQRGLRRMARQLGRHASGVPAMGSVRRGLRIAASPIGHLNAYRGREQFDYPGTALIPDLPPRLPDLIHCHNLHGGFFDLRELAPMSHRLPVALTLHDEWTFTGHCAHGLGCERWRVGCGSCPDLTIYPAIPRDATRANLRAKRDIYERSRLYITTPSQWLMDRARISVLGGAAGWRVIPNGVDRSIFRPADRTLARTRLDLPQEPFILLFAANAARRSVFKDYETVASAARRAAARLAGRPVLCIALGDRGPTETFENGELRFVPYRSDLEEVAQYYQAADLYLHAAKAENLPTTILEALATGLPVVATAVGGIPEEIHSLAGAPGGWQGTTTEVATATGVLVEPGDAIGMGSAAAMLLDRSDVRAALSANAIRDVAGRFDLGRQVDATIAWYRDVIDDWQAGRPTAGAGRSR